MAVFQYKGFDRKGKAVSGVKDADNVRALHSMIREKEKALLPWYPEKLDWYDYWLNVHFPGMRKWVLPTLEEELKAVEKRSYTYKDLLDLFETSVKRFPTRVAMRIERGGRKAARCSPKGSTVTAHQSPIRAHGDAPPDGVSTTPSP